VPQRLAGNVVANFGTWSVNEADKTLTARVEGALNPGAEGSDAKFSVSLTGDSVQLVSLGANAATIESVYRRAK
jgi:hypothetical protein